MEIKRFDSNGRMHKAVTHGGTLYLSGQVSRADSAAEQATEILGNIAAMLEQYGSSKEHILSATIYLSDMKYFAEFNEVWDAWVIEGHQPVRACVEAKLATPSFKVEICIIAALK